MQTLLPIIAAAVLLALLSGQYLRAPKRVSGGYVLTYPKVVAVIASVGLLLVAAFAGFTIYALAVTETRIALILALPTLAFGALAYFTLRQAVTRITIDDSGVQLHALWRHVSVPWREATVDAIARPQCVVLKNSSAQEIRVHESMVGAGIIDDYVRRHVDPEKIRFIRNMAGEHQLFYREPSNNRWRGP